MRWQTRTHSRSSLRRVGKLFAMSRPIVLGLLLLWVIGSSVVISYLEAWSLPHAGYFTVINVTTVGFGDVTAVTRWGKLLSGINAVVGLILFGALVAAITLAFQPSEFIGTATAADSSSSPPNGDTDHLNSRAERSVGELLRSVGTLLDTRVKSREGIVTIAVHDHTERAVHVVIDIMVQHRDHA
jgi:hypothetical protein